MPVTHTASQSSAELFCQDRLLDGDTQYRLAMRLGQVGFSARKKGGAYLCPLRSQHECGCDTPRIGNAACSNYWSGNAVDHLGNQSQRTDQGFLRGPQKGATVAASLETRSHDRIHAGAI